MLLAQNARRIVSNALTNESRVEDWINLHVNEKAWKDAARSTREGDPVTIKILNPPIANFDYIVEVLCFLGYVCRFKQDQGNARDPGDLILCIRLE
jgi:hypothetical protein